MTTDKTYRGWLILSSNGEEDDILAITPTIYKHDDSEKLAENIEWDMCSYGNNLSVRYFITDKEIPQDAVDIEWLNTLEGIGDAEYGMHYSELTGYLWTDEEIKVGGHDLLVELKSYAGKFCHLEIKYERRDN